MLKQYGIIYYVFASLGNGVFIFINCVYLILFTHFPGLKLTKLVSVVLGTNNAHVPLFHSFIATLMNTTACGSAEKEYHY